LFPLFFERGHDLPPTPGAFFCFPCWTAVRNCSMVIGCSKSSCFSRSMRVFIVCNVCCIELSSVIFIAYFAFMKVAKVRNITVCVAWRFPSLSCTLSTILDSCLRRYLNSWYSDNSSTGVMSFSSAPKCRLCLGSWYSIIIFAFSCVSFVYVDSCRFSSLRIS
jgi:hypothetical protein